METLLLIDSSYSFAEMSLSKSFTICIFSNSVILAYCLLLYATDTNITFFVVFLHMFDRFHQSQPPASKGTYSQVGFSYDGSGNEETHFPDDEDEEDEDEDDDEDDYNSDDSNDEGMDIIAKEYGVKRYGWLVYMDKKAKEEEKRQKEAIKGDPAIVSLSQVWIQFKSCFLLLYSLTISSHCNMNM